jgi:hypothetical protein
MNDQLIVLTPLVVLLLLAVFGFTGCSSFSAAPEAPAPPTTPDPGGNPQPGGTPSGQPPATAPTYKQVVAATPGFLAHWPLDEMGGNVAYQVNPMLTGADGSYVTGVPSGTGVTLGTPGVLSHKDPLNFAPEFDGSVAYVELQQYQPTLNPPNAAGVGFSVELWIKPNLALGADTQTVISSHRVDPGNKQRGYEIDVVRVPNEPHQQVRARVFAAGAQTEVTAQPTATNGNPDDWRHVVLTYDGGSPGSVSLFVRVAKNASLFKGGPVAGAYDNVTSANPAKLRFGASHGLGDVAGSFFAGRIDEVAFYSSVLSQADIDGHFNQF